MTDELVGDKGLVELRLLLPKKRDASPEWEVKIDGVVVGWVGETRIGRHSRSLFYRAHALHPDSGKLFELNVSTDRDDRVQAIVAFRANPAERKAHEIICRH